MLKKCFLSLILIFNFWLSQAQSSIILGQDTSRRPIQHTAQFLLISPDARATGMSETGAATSPDVYSIYWNPAKLAFINSNFGLAASYTPWLRNLVNDIYNLYLCGYQRLNNKEVLAASYHYFGSEQPLPPKSSAFSLAYSRQLNKKWSFGLGFKYIQIKYYDLFQPNTGIIRSTAAGDISLYYQNPLRILKKESELAFGIHISNIGGKLGDYYHNQKEFLPINLRLGTSLRSQFNSSNQLNFALDMQKLLVPTPPLMTGSGVVLGKTPADQSVLQGIINSFADAPDGLKEELQELIFSFGVEYALKNKYFARAGYFTENINKGNRKYLTTGLGFKYRVFSLDGSYILFTNQANNLLAETLKLSLSVDLKRKNT